MASEQCVDVRKYFKPCGNEKLQCTIGNCLLAFPNRTASLLKHLETEHRMDFSTVREEKRKFIRKHNDASCSNENINKVAKFDVMSACVKLIIIHGRPLSLIDDQAFRSIIAMIPETETINSHAVRDTITMVSDDIIRTIQNEVKGKLISLKLDAAYCMGQSFLALNIQFIKSEIIHRRTIGVMKLLHSHTVEYLNTFIINTCDKFSISRKQIYSITVDNTGDMFKTVQILSEDDDADNNYDDSTDDITQSQWFQAMLDKKDEGIGIHCVENSEVDFNITTIECAAQILQLTIYNFMKNEDILKITDKARKIVKKLRTPLLKSKLSEMSKKNAILDSPSRWNSTLNMLERLYELKEFCNQINYEELKLSERMWNKISDLIAISKPIRVAMKRLQSEELFVGDLYEIWQRCIIETKKIENEFATDIVTYMKNGRIKLFENILILSGIFMDPRYNVILDDSMIKQVKNCLMHTYNRIQSIPHHSSSIECDIPNKNEVVDNLEEDDFENFLQSAEDLRSRNISKTDKTCPTLENEIEEYLKEPRLKNSENILHYWIKKRNKMPKLCELAHVILAIPATRVSIERLFSALKFILSPHRSSIKQDVIDDILLIRLNSLDDIV